MSGPSRLERLPKTYLPPLSGTQTPFALIAASLFALLYTETGAYSVRMAGTRNAGESVVLLVLAGLVIFGGFLISLVFPLRKHEFPQGEFPDARPILDSLLRQFQASVLTFVGCSTVALLIYVWLVWPDLVATSNLIKDVFIYTLAGVIYYHGIVTYVRYLTYLYRVKMDSAMKVALVEAGLGLLTLILGLYLVTLDVMSLSRLGDPTGLVGLHVTVRDIWMSMIVIFAYGWHLKWVADH